MSNKIGGLKVVVYVPVRAERELEAAGLDPAKWVRQIVRTALEERVHEHREPPAARLDKDVPKPGVTAAEAAEALTRVAKAGLEVDEHFKPYPKPGR